MMKKATKRSTRIPGWQLWCAALAGVLFVVATPQAARAQQVTAADAARFLEQATFGPTTADIQHVQDIGIDAWLSEQFLLPLPAYPDFGLWPDNPPGDCDSLCQRDNYSMYPAQIRFFANAISGEDPYTGVPRQDQLRQRVAFALNQIMVISAQNPSLRQPSRMIPYLADLDQDAFGNFRDLLYDITLNPGMGRYLDMVNNNQSAPNENYAREIMQLFSIGLNMLNQDGTPMLDGQGNLVPTYTQDTVTNFARVFTGWVFAAQPIPGITNYFDPMVVGAASRHDINPKTLFDTSLYTCGAPLPGGQDAPTDLNAALDCIFNHPNVGPFIGKNLIQHLVTSNPSPDYVAYVAAAFADNGSGVRGDMQAVLRAIYEYPGVRGDTAPDGDFGHLREPVLWITNLLRAFGTNSSTSDFVLSVAGGPTHEIPGDIRTDQELFRSPTVFNFFPPDYVIPGEMLLGPEFEIQSTATALGRANFGYEMVFHAMPTDSRDRPLGTWIDENTLLSLPTDPQALVDYLNNLLLHGTMTADMNATIVGAVSSISDPLAQAREAVYLTATSSQYLVER